MVNRVLKRLLLFSPYERRVKECAAVLATQSVLGHLATLFQHETNINPAFAGLMLGQCWDAWPGPNKHLCHSLPFKA